MNRKNYPSFVVEDLVRLRRRVKGAGLPVKIVDSNLIVGTWNIKSFSQVHPEWGENPGSPKRNFRSLAYMAEIMRGMDVIAVQEVKRDTSAIRALQREFLGDDWGVILSDVAAGAGGNVERLAFVYDRRRVQLSGLAGEIVLPPTTDGNPVEQFDRTPYIVGFQAGEETFSLLTAHIRYGESPADRVQELRALADYSAREIRDRASGDMEEKNLIILGDFNIDERKNNPLFDAFVSTGLVVPDPLLNQKTTYGEKAKYYDQIAWFMGEMDLPLTERAGVIDFSGAIYREMTLAQMSYRVSDHFPLWVEFRTDRGREDMASVLGVDPARPDPFSGVPD